MEVIVFLDARQFSSDTQLDFDCCIIGAGMAGITIARELIDKRIRVCLLESGSLRRERATQRLYEGDNVSQIYANDGDNFKDYLTISRSRYFGGSSNCWGGWCRPFDELDFKKRDWVPHGNGWPFAKSELLPYYARAHKVLKIGPFQYDPKFWQNAIGNPDFRIVPFDDEAIQTAISQFSPPLRMGREYYDDIAMARDLTALLRANVVEIETGDDGRSVERVRVATLAGNRFTVGARYFVLATGGIENARLLLVSNRKHQRGLGNEHDLVGRFFMDHLTVPSGRVIFDRANGIGRSYDSLHCYNNSKFAAHGVPVATHFRISDRDQERHRILNSRTYIRSILNGDESAGVESLRNLYRLIRNTHKFPHFRMSDVLNIVTGIGSIARVALGRMLASELFVVEHRLIQVVEPSPNPDSRVTLGNGRDRLGVPKVTLDWRIADLDRHTMTIVRSLIDKEMRRLHLGRIEPWDITKTWPSKSQWTWHHMGTTRLDDDPKQGVVDRNARLHHVNNLYVAGSSVFPSCSADAPTLTITALALRLADHLQQRLRDTDTVRLSQTRLSL
jgi:choline dehydrogenase-like flavoprotein